MTERKYSVAEIDRMREAIRLKLEPRGSVFTYNEGELSARVEDRLRTYMMAGVDPADVGPINVVANNRAIYDSPGFSPSQSLCTSVGSTR